MVNKKGLEGRPILKWKTVGADLGFRGVTEAEGYYLSLESMVRSMDSEAQAQILGPLSPVK